MNEIITDNELNDNTFEKKSKVFEKSTQLPNHILRDKTLKSSTRSIFFYILGSGIAGRFTPKMLLEVGRWSQFTIKKALQNLVKKKYIRQTNRGKYALTFAIFNEYNLMKEGYCLVPNQLLREDIFKNSELLVISSLLSNIDVKGNIFGVRRLRIQDHTGLGEREFRNTIKNLKADQLIITKDYKSKNGLVEKVDYFLDVFGLENLLKKRVKKCTPPQKKGLKNAPPKNKPKGMRNSYQSQQNINLVERLKRVGFSFSFEGFEKIEKALLLVNAKLDDQALRRLGQYLNIAKKREYILKTHDLAASLVNVATGTWKFTPDKEDSYKERQRCALINKDLALSFHKFFLKQNKSKSQIECVLKDNVVILKGFVSHTVQGKNTKHTFNIDSSDYETLEQFKKKLDTIGKLLIA